MFSAQLTPCSVSMEVLQVSLCLLLPAGAVPSQSLSCEVVPSTASPVTHWAFVTSV